MASDGTGIDGFFHVGIVMMLHSQPNRKDSPRFRTTLRGWRHGQHLILDRPRDANGAYALLQEGSTCVLRFLCEGQACACESQVLTWDSHRNSPYLRLRWPKEITYTSFRKCERAPLRLPCLVERQDGLQTREELRDLSACGCSLFSARICAEGALLTLTIDLPDGVRVSNLQGIVRNVREAKGGFLLGLELLEGQEIQKNDIAFFVSTTLARRRTDADAGNKPSAILVLDASTEIFENLRAPLQMIGFEATWAGNLVDGLYRLRMLSPRALLLRQEFPDLPGIDICRIVHSVKGLEDLPIWIYGSEPKDFAKRCVDAGAKGYFPATSHLAEDITFGLTALLSAGQKQAS